MRNRDGREQPDDLPATLALNLIAFLAFLFKACVGLAAIPLAALFWLNDLGSRAIEAARQFVNPES